MTTDSERTATSPTTTGPVSTTGQGQPEQTTNGHDPRPRQHDPWLSWARVVAVVAIVTVHVFDHYVRSWGEVSALEWHVGNLADSVARFGVPLFVIVSGAALLGRPHGLGPDRSAAHESVRRFARRRIARIGIPLVVWTAFFLWFDRWSTGEPVTAYTFVQGYLWGKPYYHLYFLYVIAGLYLITPFLRVFVANASRRLVWLSALLCLTLAILDKGQTLWMGDVVFNAFSYFVPWIGYYLLGHCLAREFAARRDRLLGSPAIHRRYALQGALVFAGAVLVTAATTWLLYPRLGATAVEVTYDYLFPQTVVAAVAMAVVVWSLTTPRGVGRPGEARPSGRRLADLTFGIFLLHPIPLELWKLYGPGRTFPGEPWTSLGVHLGLLVGLLLLCGVVTAIGQRIPVLSRLV